MISSVVCATSILLFLFPWVSFGFNSLDLQPYFLVLTYIYFMLHFRGIISTPALMLLALSLASILVTVAYMRFDFTVVRALSIYFGVFLVFYFASTQQALSDRSVFLVVFAATLTWAFIGIIQTLVDRNLFDFLVSVRTTSNRGVTSLAPEPTMYAVHAVFMSVVLYILKDVSPRLCLVGVLINVVSVFVLAMSAMGILFVLLAMILLVVANRIKISVIVALLLLSVVAKVSLDSLDDDSRVKRLVAIAGDGVTAAIYFDASVNERVKHVVYPLHYQVLNAGLPQGYYGFARADRELDKHYGGFFWWDSNNSKIMSGFGATIFELGWFTAFYLLFNLYLIFWSKRRERWIVVLLLAYSISAITLAYPLLFFCYALIYRKIRKIENTPHLRKS